MGNVVGGLIAELGRVPGSGGMVGSALSYSTSTYK